MNQFHWVNQWNQRLSDSLQVYTKVLVYKWSSLYIYLYIYSKKNHRWQLELYIDIYLSVSQHIPKKLLVVHLQSFYCPFYIELSTNSVGPLNNSYSFSTWAKINEPNAKDSPLLWSWWCAGEKRYINIYFAFSLFFFSLFNIKTKV